MDRTETWPQLHVARLVAMLRCPSLALLLGLLASSGAQQIDYAMRLQQTIGSAKIVRARPGAPADTFCAQLKDGIADSLVCCLPMVAGC